MLALVEGLAETIALAEGIGVDPRAFLEMIDGGPMFAPYAKLKGEAMIERSFEPSFPLALAAKDAGLISRRRAPDAPAAEADPRPDAEGGRRGPRRGGHGGDICRALVIVDFQNDFTPGGALAVPRRR